MPTAYTDPSVTQLLDQCKSLIFDDLLPFDPIIVAGEDLAKRRIITVVSHRIPANTDNYLLSMYLVKKLSEVV